MGLTSEMPLMECGHSDNFLLVWCQRVVWRWSKLRRSSRSLCSLLLGCVSILLHGGRRPRYIVAGLVERGVAGGSTRADLYGG